MGRQIAAPLQLLLFLAFSALRAKPQVVSRQQVRSKNNVGPARRNRLSGTLNKQVADASLMRMAQAGAVITNWFAVACELQRDWRKNGEGLANLLANHLPAYKNLITSHNANTKR